MPDIIEQLEIGKKIQEEEGIDVDSLRTKISSSEEENTEKPKQKRKKKEQQEKSIEEEKSEDPFEQAEQIMNQSKKSENQPEEQKPEKYPGFDFNDYYEVGQKIFFIRVHESLGIKEFKELKIRTIYPKMIIGCEEKKSTQCIGPDSRDMIFTDRKLAVEAYDNMKIKVFKDTDIKSELGDTEIEDMEE